MSIKKITNNFIPPYHSHIHENIIWLEDKKLLLTFLIEGIPYESLTDDMILNNFNGQKKHFLDSVKVKEFFCGNIL